MHIEFTLFDGSTVALRSDSMNYMLAKPKSYKEVKTGEMVDGWEAFSYHASLEHALTKLLNLKLRSSSAKSLMELRADLEAIRKEIFEMWSSTITKKAA